MSASRSNGFEKDPERARAAGRKSRRSLSIQTRLTQMLNAPATIEWLQEMEDAGLKPINKDIREVLLFKHIALGLKNDRKAINDIYDRSEGPVVQKVQNVAEDVRPLQIPEDKRNEINKMIQESFTSQAQGAQETLGDTDSETSKNPEDSEDKKS